MGISGISSKAADVLENKDKFNGGSELNEDLGISLYETDNRNYDAQLGSFRQIDKLAAKFMSWSPYQFGYDNPIGNNDPTGLETITQQQIMQLYNMPGNGNHHWDNISGFDFNISENEATGYGELAFLEAVERKASAIYGEGGGGAYEDEEESYTHAYNLATALVLNCLKGIRTWILKFSGKAADATSDYGDIQKANGCLSIWEVDENGKETKSIGEYVAASGGQDYGLLPNGFYKSFGITLGSKWYSDGKYPEGDPRINNKTRLNFKMPLEYQSDLFGKKLYFGRFDIEYHSIPADVYKGNYNYTGGCIGIKGHWESLDFYKNIKSYFDRGAAFIITIVNIDLNRDRRNH